MDLKAEQIYLAFADELEQTWFPRLKGHGITNTPRLTTMAGWVDEVRRHAHWHTYEFLLTAQDRAERQAGIIRFDAPTERLAAREFCEGIRQVCRLLLAGAVEVTPLPAKPAGPGTPGSSPLKPVG